MIKRRYKKIVEEEVFDKKKRNGNYKTYTPTHDAALHSKKRRRFCGVSFELTQRSIITNQSSCFIEVPCCALP